MVSTVTSGFHMMCRKLTRKHHERPAPRGAQHQRWLRKRHASLPLLPTHSESANIGLILLMAEIRRENQLRDR